MKIVVNGVNYHVELVGQGEPLVLLHGFTGSGKSWAEHVEVFAEKYQVVTVDLLGHGQTESPDDPERYRIEHAARDLAALFNQLRLGKVHLLGYSMGGRLALYTAVHYPEALHIVILESASPGLENADERRLRVEQDERLTERILQDGLPRFVDYWESLPLWATQTPEIKACLREQRLQNNAVGLANSLRGMGTGVQPSLWEELPTLHMPTLLIAGDQDVKFADIARQMHERVSHSQLHLLPRAGHTTHLEQPEAFRKEVINFISRYSGYEACLAPTEQI